MENKKYCILIVDDSPLIIMELTKILSDDYEIFTEINAQNVMETAMNLLPDLILLDIIMPDEDGYTTLASLKIHERTKNIPVIFISGLTNADNEEKGLAWGAADYITKPFSPEIVKLRIQNQIAMVSQMQEIEALRKERDDYKRLLLNTIDELRIPIDDIAKTSAKALGKKLEDKVKGYFNNILLNINAHRLITDNALKNNIKEE